MTWKKLKFLEVPKTKTLPAIKLGRRVLIPASALDALEAATLGDTSVKEVAV